MGGLEVSILSRPTIALLTDFGHRDHYVGVMKGVIARIAPDARVIARCHEIPPQDVDAAAFMLMTSMRYLPDDTIFVCVVDPGVGSARDAIGVRCGRRVLIGPDNGLFTLAVGQHAALDAVVLDNPRYHLLPVSHTFHGRDIFSPTAAHLAAGVPFEELGSEKSLDALAMLDELTPQLEGKELQGRVIHMDHFGNLITNLSKEACELLHGKAPGLKIELPEAQLALEVLETFSDVPIGDAVAYAGSSGMLEIAIRQGSAREKLGIKKGARVVASPSYPRT
ncbi:MAG: SAM-dependent chlorinase/fluorinase [Myxococcota bacterium]|nr:SAM-dependent chlorinase/fluorinase [Myxococcota bacterium]